jgi:hypothetical protein
MTVTVGLTVTMTVVKVKRRMTMLRLTRRRGWVLNLRRRKDKKISRFMVGLQTGSFIHMYSMYVTAGSRYL